MIVQPVVEPMDRFTALKRTEKVLALSSAEFVCSDICITLNYVHALENICNKIKLYCIVLICSSAYGVRKQTFPINYLTTEQLICSVREN